MGVRTTNNTSLSSHHIWRTTACKDIQWSKFKVKLVLLSSAIYKPAFSYHDNFIKAYKIQQYFLVKTEADWFTRNQNGVCVANLNIRHQFFSGGCKQSRPQFTNVLSHANSMLVLWHFARCFHQSINQSINVFQGKIQTVQFTNIYKHILFYTIYSW